jgi:uncharacterized protein YkuJ
MDWQHLITIWSPDHGFNWNLVTAWAIFLFLTKGLWRKLSERLSHLLLKILNKVPLLQETDLDEYIVENLQARLVDMVSARMSRAKDIKTEYTLKITEAMESKDYDKVQLLSKEMKEKLEELTEEVKDDFIDGEGFFWGLLQDRYGDKAKAAKWVVDKIKAIVVALKDPGDLSTTAVIMKNAVHKP